MPLASLLQSAVHIGVLHFEAVLPLSFLIFISIMQAMGWMAVGGIWTHCEISGSPTPGLCPQNRMVDLGKNGLMGVAIFKDSLAWVLALAHAALFALAIREIRDRWRNPWMNRDEFLELAEYETKAI